MGYMNYMYYISNLASSQRISHSGDTTLRSVKPKFNMTLEIEPIFAGEKGFTKMTDGILIFMLLPLIL